MNTPLEDPGAGRLTSLLRETRPARGLPLRFKENVWRRIEKADSNSARIEEQSWIMAIAARVLKPSFAFSTAAVLLAAGILLGSLDGAAQARHEAQERYLAAVAMSVAP
jgi:hypothetical protein